jgi:hypothetical protein
MNILDDDNKINNYVIDLAVLAIKKSKIHPVDREFLSGQLEQILSIQSNKFIYHNLELENDLYTTLLFACLPEVWKKITLDEVIRMSEKFTNVFSYFTLIKFTYKYIEIDIIEHILNTKNVKHSQAFLHGIIDYLECQWNVLVKSESDLEDFRDGFIDVDYEEWLKIKQRFLLDKTVKPAYTSYKEIKGYINQLVTNWKNKSDGF